jgi:hypothetical protein
MVCFFVWGGLEKSVVGDSLACNDGQLGRDVITESSWTEKLE